MAMNRIVGLSFVGLWLAVAGCHTAPRGEVRQRHPGDLRQPTKLRVGDPAPNFKLKRREGGEVRLAGFRGQRPVVLVFGSYT